MQQIQLPVLNHRADVGVDLPELAGLLEVFDKHLNRETTLHLKLAVDARFGFLEHLLRKVRREDFDRQPATAAAISFTHIASEYGSWPVEPAARQIRRLFRPARARNISGMIDWRK